MNSGSTAGLGGFVSFNDGGLIVDSYATGYVQGGGSGFVANNGGGTNFFGPIPTGTVTDSFWDEQTSGTGSGYGTGETTAQLQSALPGTFSSSLLGGGNSAYPYLKSFYPNGIQVVSGTAYANLTLAGAAGTPVTVYASGVGVTTTAGANSYYYAALPAGTISTSGTPVLAYDANGADVQTETAGYLFGFNILGSNGVIARTSDTTLSQAIATPLEAQNTALISTAAGGNAAVIAAVSAMTNNDKYIATGPLLTIDQAVNGSLFVDAINGARITVSQPVTITGNQLLALETSGAVAVDAPITVNGASPVVLDVGTTSAFGATEPGLWFGLGDEIDFGSVNQGATLAINGASYTLLYSLSDIQNLNGSSTMLQGAYALANSINASGFTGSRPIGVSSTGTVLNGGAGFSGTFEGLGNAISNLGVSLF